ncbi:hypothetical protein CUT44_17515 [Streptomyces carminius]|uniref:Uncharacterized protein n=1 Tax=Streptomyces carminius TaxID=2665496 RepID=A0A2M8LWI7_9ACTN|nr:hypothetical protein [Streptomyces carminius]PJE96332.1 hypothetical protein CUT44_17515 [Streptomyces carminius]
MPGPLDALPAAEAAGRLSQAPGAALIAPTAAFDALVVPRLVGMAALVMLEREARVPCIVMGGRAVLLVLSGTGGEAAAVSGRRPVEVRTGTGGWVALPPSHGTRWDTPPWAEPAAAPLRLMHGRDIGCRLAEAFRCHGAEGLR